MAEDVYEAMLNKQSGAPEPAAPGQQPAAAPAAQEPPAQPTPPPPIIGEEIKPIAQESRQKRLDVDETQPAAAGASTAQPGAPLAPVFNEEAFFSEKSGGKFKTWDDIQAAMNKQPEVIKETVQPTFANDASKNLFEMLVAGKEEEALPIIQKRVFAKKLNDLADDDVIISRIREQHPSLDETKAKRYFERQYAINESEYTAEDLEIEKALLIDKKKTDAQSARKYFTDAVGDLQFPATAAAAPATVPQMSDAAKQVMQFGQEFAKADTSVFPFEFAPEGSQLKVKGQITPSADKVKQLSEQLGNDPEAFVAGFITKNWMKDGKFDKEAVARDLTFLSEAPLMFNSVASKVVNQVLEQRLALEKNLLNGNGGANPGKPVEVGQNVADPWEAFFHIPAAKKTA